MAKENGEMDQGTGLRPRQLAIYTATVALTLLGVFIVYKLMDLIVLVLFCMIAATAMEPVVNRLRRGPFNRAMGILVVYTFIFIFIAGILLLTVPALVNQVSNLVTNLPQLQKNLSNTINSMNLGYFSTQITDFINKLDFGQVASSVGQGAAGAVFGVASTIFTFILAFVIIFYWMTERTVAKRYIISFFAPSSGQRIRRIWDDIEEKVGAWTRGQFTLMATIAGAAMIVYSFVFNLPYAPVLAIIAGLMELIPVIGPWIAAVPTLLVAATVGFDTVLWVAGYSVVIQLLEANLLVPRIMKSSVGISPLTVILALLAGETLGGPVGALLAVPLAGAVTVVIEDLRGPMSQAEKANAASAERPGATAKASSVDELTAAEAEEAGVGPAQPVTYATTFKAAPPVYDSIADLATQVTTPDESVLLTSALGPDTQVGPLVQTTIPANGSTVGKVSTSGPALTTISTSETPVGPRTTVVTQASDGQAVLTTEKSEEE